MQFCCPPRPSRLHRLLGSATVVAVMLGSSGPVTGLEGGPIVKDRTIRDESITEASGLAPSLRHPGVLWTHQDSGHPPQLHAISTSGRTLATLRVRGAEAYDWEAMASLPGPGREVGRTARRR